MNFAVIGAGVVSLTTALELQREFPSANITILAEKLGTETANYGNVGVFRPPISFNGPSNHITNKWISDAWNYWNTLSKSADGSLAGVTQLSIYSFTNIGQKTVQNQHLEKILSVHRQVTKPELEICPGNWTHGTYSITTLTDYSVFHHWAANKFTSSGGQIKQQRIHNFVDLIGKYDAVLNCSGLGAGELCNDPQVTPIRNQFIRVKAPWLKTGFYANSDRFVVPGFRGEGFLGGSEEYSNWNPNISERDSFNIKNKCEELVPSLVSSPIISQSVSLSGHRGTVRVEQEIFETSNHESIWVVHNYGHGFGGTIVSPGTAKYAVSLLKDVLVKTSKL